MVLFWGSRTHLHGGLWGVSKDKEYHFESGWDEKKDSPIIEMQPVFINDEQILGYAKGTNNFYVKIGTLGYYTNEIENLPRPNHWYRFGFFNQGE